MTDSTALYDDDAFCDKHEVVTFGSFAVPIVLSVVITLSLTGNILVLVIVTMYEKLKSVTNIFIFNLAISDLVFTCGLPFWTIYHIWGWLFSETLCKVVNLVFFTGFYSSILFLTIMTVYRYLSVVRPLSGQSKYEPRTGVFLSVLLWMISVGAAIPSLFFSSLVSIPHKDEHSKGCEYNASMWKIVGVSQQNVFFLFAFVVMAFCYIKILWRIRRTRSHTKKRAVKLIISIVIVFFLGWGPYNIVMFLKLLDDNLVSPFDACEVSIRLDYALYVCRLVAFTHCCLNPVFYVLVGARFRRHLTSMLHRIPNPKNAVSDQPLRMQNIISQGSMY